MDTKRTLLRKAMRYTIYSFLTLLAIITVLIMLAPAAGLYFADRWYQSQGENYSLTAKDWKFAPLKFSLSLHDVQLNHTAGTTHIETVSLTFDPWALWQKKLHVNAVQLDGVQLDVTYQQQGAELSEVLLAGLAFPLQTATEQVPTQQTLTQDAVADTSKPWSIAIEAITLKNDTLHWRIADVNAKQPSMKGEITIHEFSFRDFYWPVKPGKTIETGFENIPVSIALNAQIAGFEMLGDNAIKLKSPLSVTVNGQIFEPMTEPVWQGSVQLEKLDMQWRDELTVAIQKITLEDLLANSERIVLESFDVFGVDVNNIKMKDDVSVSIATPLSRIRLDQYQANNLFYLIPAEDDPDSSTFAITEQTITGLNHISLKDKRINPAYEGEITLYELSLGVLSINPHSGEIDPTSLSVELGLDEYHRLKLEGELGWVPNLQPDAHDQEITASIKKHHPQGQLTLTTKQLDIVPFNGYLNQAMGYHAERGMLDLDANIGMQDAQLNGEVNILVRNSKFVPSDKETISRISKQISMPLDTALDLLRDSNGNVRLTVPLSGSLNDPNVGFNDLTSQLSKLALKKSALYFVQQSLQPYTTLISLASYAGDYLFAIRLDALNFETGKAELTAEHQERISNIAAMMQKKTDLELTVCPFSSEQEVNTLKDGWTKLVAQRAANVKATLATFKDEKGASLATRVTLCKPQQGEKAEVVLGVE